jgi:tRNA(Ile)-lysidine synthase
MPRGAGTRRRTIDLVEPAAIRSRVEEHVRRLDLVPAGGEVVCLVSGGPDSTCLWHVLSTLGYRAAAIHVHHHLRGAESDEDARFCRDVLGAEVVDAPGEGLGEAGLRDLRYAVAADRLRATGHTASDQVETVLFRLVSSGRPTGVHARRADGVVRPLLCLWRDETEAYCRAESLAYRVDSTNQDTKRGLIRDEIMPLLRRLHPAAERNLLRALEQPDRLPRPLERALTELLASREGSKRLDLGAGRVAVREYQHLWLERAPVRLMGPVDWNGWRIEPRLAGLVVRGWRSGDRLAGHPRRSLQDLFVDAKIPRSEREAWPLVVRGDDVVVVPGVAAAPGYEEAVVATRSGG